MKITKWIRTNEDWCPTIDGNSISPNEEYCNPLPDPAVKVFMCQLTDGMWRVAVWGGDDFGLEIDLPKDCKNKAKEIYENIIDYTTQDQLKSLGFYHG